MSVRVRVAPSPTGNLHIGTARTALFNWLYARRHQGKFILRIEDTDRERSKPEFTQNILDGLAWLGLNFDEGPFFQTDRQARYIQAIQELLDRGLAYYCYTTEAELEAMREEQKAQKLAPRYDNRHRHLTPAQRLAYQQERQSSSGALQDCRAAEVSARHVRGEMRWTPEIWVETW
jgi:glutamyl-tRNA synthetase (EC 6.1.1.17)/glutamate--tRNA(Gln) ligase (EC 6.1.1.24)